jgi:hypothetical protein
MPAPVSRLVEKNNRMETRHIIYKLLLRSFFRREQRSKVNLQCDFIPLRVHHIGRFSVLAARFFAWGDLVIMSEVGRSLMVRHLSEYVRCCFCCSCHCSCRSLDRGLAIIATHHDLSSLVFINVFLDFCNCYAMFGVVCVLDTGLSFRCHLFALLQHAATRCLVADWIDCVQGR